MRIGIIARSDDRGLGTQTWEATRHLNPDRVLLIEPKPAGWFQHAERFAEWDTTTVQWHHGHLPEGPAQQWLRGLDVVYTAESDYDLRMSAWCGAAGVTLVRHANPEQLAREEVKHAAGTVWWAATDWRLEHLPAGTRVVPMPVALDRFPTNLDSAAANPSFGAESSRPVRFLHSIGHQAQDDRAGSRCVARAIRHVEHPCELAVRCQDRRMDVGFSDADRVAVSVHSKGVDNYWDQYDGCDVLLLPRRYGGLSLPSNEAAAAGLVVVMSDCSPNETWPGLKVPIHRRREVHMRCGPVQVCDPDPRALADLMTGLAEDRTELARLQVEARRWAEANSWEALTPLWLAELERASLSRGGRLTATA